MVGEFMHFLQRDWRQCAVQKGFFEEKNRDVATRDRPARVHGRARIRYSRLEMRQVEQ
jgi:hypothetical protein